LTLLGSYLTDAYNGDVRCRSEVSGHLAHDVRQGVHARKIMESYQAWFGEGPELVLRMLGLFDRPADGRSKTANILFAVAFARIAMSVISCRTTCRSRPSARESVDMHWTQVLLRRSGRKVKN